MIRHSMNAGAGRRLIVRHVRRRVGLALIALFSICLLQSCRYPRDVEGTLEQVEGGVLNVGVTENPPWVIRTASGATGLEPAIVTSLANNLNAEIRWHWGNESALLDALKQYQLDLVIGGLTDNKRLAKVAAPSKPYFQSRVTVGVPAPEPIPASLDGLTVAVPAVNHLHKALVTRGASPQAYTRIEEVDGAIAGPEWRLRAHGFAPGPWKLATEKHVFALPHGENGWMMAVQRHLDRQSGLSQRLQALEAEG